MSTFLFIIFLIILADVFIAALILLGISRLFRISSISYKKSLLIIFVIGLISFLLTTFFSVFLNSLLTTTLTGIISFVVFHAFLKRYYSVSLLRSLGIYVVSNFCIVLMTLAIALPVRMFVFEPFVVNGDSMSPTLKAGELLFIDKLANEYERGDIVVFRRDNTYLIKRIVGIPGDKINITKGKLILNGSLYENNYASGELVGEVEVSLRDNEFFVLGDNLSKSGLDSRNIGPIRYENIVGEISNRF